MALSYLPVQSGSDTRLWRNPVWTNIERIKGKDIVVRNSQIQMFKDIKFAATKAAKGRLCFTILIIMLTMKKVSKEQGQAAGKDNSRTIASAKITFPMKITTKQI